MQRIIFHVLADNQYLVCREVTATGEKIGDTAIHARIISEGIMLTVTKLNIIIIIIIHTLQ